jgi:NAD(P)-dependent dehydrogenase (short-subunit alcohol dehydrogenase family)
VLLANRVAVITGGAKGIGKGIALKFAGEGCEIAVADVMEEAGNETLKELAKKGKPGIFIKCDHTDEHQVQDMVQKVIDKFGKIDILVNNAGGFGPPVPITELTLEAWTKSINLNLTGVFLCCKAVIPHMMKKHYGKIINMSSISAVAAGPPSPHYGSSKGGILSLTLDLALETARFGINVNAILPGTIRTDMWKTNIPPGADDDKFFSDMAQTLIPLQRIGTPDDVAGAALFLASHLSDYVTGDRIIVAGGLPLRAPTFGKVE